MTRRHMVVSYDVVDDRRRARLARFVRGYADRVQKSVFEGEVPERRVQILRDGVRAHIDEEEDSVRLYTLCERCQAATEIVGTGVYIEGEEEDVVV
jgi:CRISPR-associated protein Cas2